MSTEALNRSSVVIEELPSKISEKKEFANTTEQGDYGEKFIDELVGPGLPFDSDAYIDDTHKVGGSGDRIIRFKNGFVLMIEVKNEKIIGGVIDCPALQERWMSFDTDTTIVNGNNTKCREIDKLENSVMATTSSHEFGMEKWRAYQSLEESVKVTTTGSDCYNYGLLASGYLDIVAEKLTAPHDYLPLIKIVQGAGGIMTDWEGNNLNFSDKNVYVLASSSNRLHELALEKLRAE